MNSKLSLVYDNIIKFNKYIDIIYNNEIKAVYLIEYNRVIKYDNIESIGGIYLICYRNSDGVDIVDIYNYLGEIVYTGLYNLELIYDNIQNELLNIDKDIIKEFIKQNRINETDREINIINKNKKLSLEELEFLVKIKKIEIADKRVREICSNLFNLNFCSLTNNNILVIIKVYTYCNKILTANIFNMDIKDWILSEFDNYDIVNLTEHTLLIKGTRIWILYKQNLIYEIYGKLIMFGIYSARLYNVLIFKNSNRVKVYSLDREAVNLVYDTDGSIEKLSSNYDKLLIHYKDKYSLIDLEHKRIIAEQLKLASISKHTYELIDKDNKHIRFK